MQTSQSQHHMPLAAAERTTKIVVFCDHDDQRSVVPLLESLSWYPGVELHILDAESASERNAKPPTVIPSSWNFHEMLATSEHGASLWRRCGPGSPHERVLRYCARAGADLVIVHQQPARGLSGWFQRSLAERISDHIPVLTMPVAGDAPFDPESPFRWLVVLDGSSSAESVLQPLRSITRWLPSQVSLLQPLQYAQLWDHRVVQNSPSFVPRMGVSIADSSDYLLSQAARHLPALAARVCCLSDHNPIETIRSLIASDAVDGIAVGLSKRFPWLRLAVGEFNDRLLRSTNKPCLLTTMPV